MPTILVQKPDLEALLGTSIDLAAIARAPGAGTCFRVRLPIESPGGAPA